MVCRSNSNPAVDQQNRAWSNWAGTASNVIQRYVEPSTLPELVEIVAQASEGGHQLHALGSGWAFEDLATADWVVNLGQLTMELTTVLTSALTDQWQAQQVDPASKVVLFHVEAGVEIGMLNLTLASKQLAMISLGGANGQTLAGAISTSTHGGDLILPPLPGLVQAIHLVTHGGQEIWLERASAPITTDARLRPTLTCAETQIIRDDDLFNAVLVSVGRFGVIYSLVLSVARAYALAEWTVLLHGDDVRASLRAGVDAGTGVQPLLDSLADPPAALGAINGAKPNPPRFLQVLFNSQAPDACFVTRRWATDEATPLNLDFMAQFPCNPGDPQLVLDVAAAAIKVASGALMAIPFVGPFWAGEAVVAAVGLESLAVARPPVSGGDAVAASVNAAWDNHLGSVTPAITQFVLSSRFANSMKEGRRGQSDLIMTGDRASNQSTCFRADSSEIVFPATTTAYLDFLDMVLPASPGFDQSGVVSCRFSAPSTALISMHNWAEPLVVSIESASLSGLRGNTAWHDFIQVAALANGGRPHWGQINKLTESDVAALYGSSLVSWQEALMTVSGTSTVFSNSFTRHRGLEPVSVLRQVKATRKVHSGGGSKTITHLCSGPNEHWAPVSVATAIQQIQDGTIVYFTEAGGSTAKVLVVDNPLGAYLRTAADSTTENNLDLLPDC